jgi:RNA polymerase sigma factor (sigma-70 family)
MSDVLAPSAVDWKTELARHDRWLRTVAFARLGCRHAVDDVLQEVALAVVRDRAPLADAAKISPWLYRLTILQSLLYRRSAGRRRKLVHAAEERFRCDEGSTPDPIEWLVGEERREQLRAAIDQLRPQDAEILLLKYTEGWSYRQIAERLGIREAAVEARLHRARGKLRELLAAKSLAES